MKINIYPIISPLHNQQVISKSSETLIKSIGESLDSSIGICDLENLYNADFSMILVQSGGSEGEFIKVIDKLKGPFYLLTYGSNNSLAASMEILSYLKSKGEKAEILHGSVSYIAKRIIELHSTKTEKKIRLGVLGEPSDWLIASKVNYQDALNLHNIELVDLDINNVIKNFDNYDPKDFKSKMVLDFDKDSLDASKKLVLQIDDIVKKENLDGITIRCFDFLSTIHTTACLSLALLNERGIIGTCEGDIPAMISMFITYKLCGQTGFQCNPSRIDIDNKEMVLAHCTLPFNMVNQYKLDTHFESGIGVAVKGELSPGKITIFKLSKNMKDYYLSTGEIKNNLSEKNLCRTQIQIGVDKNIGYFLRNPYGNHHIIIYGDHEAEITEYMEKL